jgi:predicted AlkP superfamily phosphohydrolase/phosphomutase
VIIGLDGGTAAVISEPDAALPNITAPRLDGAHAALQSTTPPITAAAWPSMMTGWNPGRHGMYDFRDLHIERYTRHWGAGQPAEFEQGSSFVKATRWAGSALWDRFGASGVSLAGT